MSHTVRYATPEEITHWDELLVRNPDGGALLQTHSFALTKALSGWKAHYFVCEGAQEPIYALVLERSVFGMGKLWYLPQGPGCNSASDFTPFLPSFRKIATEQGVFVIKFEPEMARTPENVQALSAAGLILVEPVQQSVSTVVLDLEGSPEEVLARMPQKGRYAIRRAERDGVTTARVDPTEENMNIMFALLSATASDAGFMVRPKRYYTRFWSEFALREHGQFFFAYVDGEVVSAAYVAQLGTTAFYKDGASVRKKQAYGASHALQWAIISWFAENTTARTYDLMGSPPSDRLSDPTHHLHGVGKFKLSLSETVIDRVGTWDLVLKSGAYRRWRAYGYRLADKFARMRRKEVFF
jgi:lipid II:glycine glycyltransferase (peptidoglycan interpeptide bridge formation enzyme)